nr:hypothetical protein [Tanacetum cinerariifolium]
MQMVGGNGENQFRQYAGQNVGNLNGYNAVQNVGNLVIQNVAQNPRAQNIGNQNGLIGVLRNANQNLNGNDLDEIEEVNANCILMANLQQASTSGTQTDKAPNYDLDGSAEVHNYENYDDNEIFNMFTQEEQYTELLEPIHEPHQVPQNDNNIISEDSSMEQSGKTVEQHPANVEETLTSNSVSTPQESKVVKNDKVIAPGMFRINPFKMSKEEKHVPNTVRASARTKPITVSQPTVITKKVENSDSNGLSSTGVDHTKTRRPQPRSNTKNDRVPSAYKSSRSKNKEVEVEEHHRNLLLSKNTKHMSSACNNIKPDSQNVISKVVCAVCKQCLISVNHDPKVKKTKKVGFATPKPSKPRFCLRWSPTGRLFDLKGKIIESSESKSQSDCSNGDNASTFNTMEPKIKQFLNSTSLLGSLWELFALGMIMLLQFWVSVIFNGEIPFVEGLSHNLLSVGQFCDSDLEVAFRRNACFVRNLEGVDLLKGDHSTNLYTINLHEMPLHLQSVSWLVLLPLSHGYGINVYPSHPPKPIPNSRQRKLDISFLHVFGALCYPKNDCEDIGKLGAKCDIGFFIGYSADSCAYRVYNRRTKKIIKTMNVSFDELLAMAFEQSELDLLFEVMYDDFIGGQPSAAMRTVPAAQAQQVRQTSTLSTSIADSAPTPTNSSS